MTTGIRYHQSLPTKLDKDLDGEYIYPGVISTKLSNLDPDSPSIPEKYVLTNEGKVLFLSHFREKKTSNDRELQLNSELMTLLFSRISPISRITLASHKDFNNAFNSKDTLTLFNIINETHRTGSSKTAITQLRKYITCSMSNRSHQIYMHEFKELEATTRANFADKDDKISLSLSHVTI